MWNCLLQNTQSIWSRVTKKESLLHQFLQELEDQICPDIAAIVLFAFDDPAIQIQLHFRLEP